MSESGAWSDSRLAKTEGESVAHWLDGVRNGNREAAEELWNRYFARLAVVAQSRLGQMTRESDGEDVALSALKSVMLGVQKNRYPNLTDHQNLWPLLVAITAKKSVSEIRRQLARKRSSRARVTLDDVRDYIGVEPTSEFAIEVADELDRLMRTLHDSTLRRIVELKLGGSTHEEIAAELGCTVRTVIRKLNRVRHEWRVGYGGEQSSEVSDP
ncbi:MAG TPA: ECF-type sigma factor [Chthoniobacteraceae bacterium]|jgi:DNA-directed RNA polymerase specialized sigma24 family protein|nr:ECF-type sigma factor [Chthoniobacteraceae bacterium]